MHQPSEPHESAALAAFQGLLSGGLGTVPMTAAMAAIKQFLPAGAAIPFAPANDRGGHFRGNGSRRCAFDRRDGNTRLGFPFRLRIAARSGLWSFRPPTPLQGIGGGMAFGLAVWCGSYLGWLPAFNMRASATKEPAQRNAMMIAAHLIWGGGRDSFKRRSKRKTNRIAVSGC